MEVMVVDSCTNDGKLITAVDDAVVVVAGVAAVADVWSTLGVDDE